MSITRQSALEEIRRYPLTATPHLVEQSFVHAGRVEVGAPFHHRDIDFWAAATDRQAVAELFDQLDALRLSTTRRPEWLNHDVYLLDCSDGSLLVDVKFGDLKVGALTLLSESELLWSLDEDNRIGGPAQIATQFLSRLTRGKSVDSTRLESVIGDGELHVRRSIQASCREHEGCIRPLHTSDAAATKAAATAWPRE